MAGGMCGRGVYVAVGGGMQSSGGCAWQGGGQVWQWGGVCIAVGHA